MGGLPAACAPWQQLWGEEQVLGTLLVHRAATHLPTCNCWHPKGGHKARLEPEVRAASAAAPPSAQIPQPGIGALSLNPARRGLGSASHGYLPCPKGSGQLMGHDMASRQSLGRPWEPKLMSPTALSC